MLEVDGRVWFAVPRFDPAATPCDDLHELARALGTLHRAAAAPGGAGAGGVGGGIDMRWAAEALASAAPAATLAKFPGVAAALERECRGLQHKAVFLHTDFQAKNVLREPPDTSAPTARRRLRICDTEGATAGSRVLDLYFLFTGGGDDAAGGGDGETSGGRTDSSTSTLAALLRTYAAHSWPLTREEARALPTVWQAKAACVAAWAHRLGCGQPDPVLAAIAARYRDAALAAFGRAERLSGEIREAATQPAAGVAAAPTRQRRDHWSNWHQT